jgi:hypothetical protein
VLSGTEIKSIRAGKVNLADAFARIERGEAWLIGAHIAPWESGNRYNHEPKRDRKLLLHRRQIDQLVGRTKAKGLTLVPLKRWSGSSPTPADAEARGAGLCCGRRRGTALWAGAVRLALRPTDPSGASSGGRAEPRRAARTQARARRG